MGQEVSISYQAVKSKVYRLIDALVEGSKSEQEVQESMQRWWKLVHPADRPVAQKYVLMVLNRSTASLGAITGGLQEFKEFASIPLLEEERFAKFLGLSSAREVGRPV